MQCTLPPVTLRNSRTITLFHSHWVTKSVSDKVTKSNSNTVFSFCCDWLHRSDPQLWVLEHQMFYCFVMIQMHFRLWELEKVGKMIFEFLTEICEAERTYVCKKRLQIWLTVSAHYFLFTFFCDHLQGAKICIFDSILVGKWGMMLHIMCNMSKIPINIQGWPGLGSPDRQMMAPELIFHRKNLESDYIQYLIVGKTNTNLYHITFICPIFTYYISWLIPHKP